MNIKIVRDDAQPSYTLFSSVESTAYDIMRSHVRAYDSDDDALLRLYLDAAIDYMQELSDRILGTSVVTIKLNKSEIEGPITIPKVQDITHLHSLKYRSKDGDLEIPYSESYSFYLDEIPANTPASGVSLTVGERAYEIPHTNHTQSLSLQASGQPDGFNATTYTQTFDYWDTSTNAWLDYEDVDSVSDTYADDRPLTNNAHLPIGMYRFTDTLTNAASETAVSTFYFVVTDGSDLFDCRVATDRYPMYLKIDNLLHLPDDASDYDEDYIEIVLDAGTALGDLPAQYSQAALLLLGHYYNMREAENIGGITSELKEGVKRLIQSVRQF
jgi:hypothetical protein